MNHPDNRKQARLSNSLSHSQIHSQQLFRRSRLRLAGWYALVMGGILSLCGLGMYRVLVQTQWVALEREIESIAGTLHDSLEPILPASDNPTQVLQQIFPDLCIVEQPCQSQPLLIQRHTIGISDRTTYYIRLFDHQGTLLAFSPNQPESRSSALDPAPWQTIQPAQGERYHQFTTILHSSHAHAPGEAMHDHPAWGYLQVGRTLAPFDADTQRLRWTLMGGLPLALGLIAIASWGLSGLAMQPIYQSYRRQQQFTADVAHELRSPLASLLATVEAILRLPPNQSADIPPMLHTVERQGRRLSQLITDLLFLTHLEQNTTEPKVPTNATANTANANALQPCCLNDIVADLTEEFSELAAAADIHLQGQFPERQSPKHQSPECQIPKHQIPEPNPGAAIYTMGHESQLYQLLSNLIANAIQYTPPGGSVIVSLGVRDRFATIAVKDTGIGIAPEDQRHIFERFYRVNGDRSRQTGGTGLGLAIAQAIVQRHRGLLKVDSAIGQGSVFTVSLPYGGDR